MTTETVHTICKAHQIHCCTHSDSCAMEEEHKVLLPDSLLHAAVLMPRHVGAWKLLVHMCMTGKAIEHLHDQSCSILACCFRFWHT